MEFFDFKAVEVWFANHHIWVKLSDGQVASLPLAAFPRLAAASNEQLLKYEIIDGYALYWPELDEDLSVAGFFENETKKQPTEAFTINHL